MTSKYHTAFMVTLLLAVSTCLVVYFLLLRQYVVKDQRVLHTITSRDLDTCFQIVANYQVVTKGVGALQEHRIRVDSIRVVQIDLNYGIRPPILKLNPDGQWTASGTTRIPVWQASYVPHAEFTVPTGRLFFTHCGDLLAIIHDGHQYHMFEYNTDTRRCVEVRDTTKYRRLLREAFRTSFAVEDVYWSYAMIRHAGYFGYAAESIPFDTFVSTKTLYSTWREAAFEEKD